MTDPCVRDANGVPVIEWMLLDHRWDESWTGCEHCGRPIKRVYLIEHAETGERKHVGQTCLGVFGIATRRATRRPEMKA